MLKVSNVCNKMLIWSNLTRDFSQKLRYSNYPTIIIIITLIFLTLSQENNFPQSIIIFVEGLFEDRMELTQVLKRLILQERKHRGQVIIPQPRC